MADQSEVYELPGGVVVPPEKALRESDVVSAAREFSEAFAAADISDESEVRGLDQLNQALRAALEAYDRAP